MKMHFMNRVRINMYFITMPQKLKVALIRGASRISGLMAILTSMRVAMLFQSIIHSIDLEISMAP